jgi:hypothetical protein
MAKDGRSRHLLACLGYLVPLLGTTLPPQPPLLQTPGCNQASLATTPALLDLALPLHTCRMDRSNGRKAHKACRLHLSCRRSQDHLRVPLGRLACRTTRVSLHVPPTLRRSGLLEPERPT